MNTKISIAGFNKFAVAVAGFALLAMAVPALAQSGQFTYVIGTVTIERVGQAPVQAFRGDSVRPLDVIKTGADGMAQLAMVDLAKLSLRSNSQLIVQQYPVGASDPPGAILNLVRGTLRSFTALLTGPNKAGYRMQTRSPQSAFVGPVASSKFSTTSRPITTRLKATISLPASTEISRLFSPILTRRCRSFRVRRHGLSPRPPACLAPEKS